MTSDSDAAAGAGYPFRDIAFAEEVMPGKWLVTLACGHKLYTAKKQVRYPCPECIPSDDAPDAPVADAAAGAGPAVTEELLPCPFCGGRPRFDETEGGGHYIECEKCGASTNLMFSLKEPVSGLLAEKWNRRTAARARQRRDAPTPQRWVPVAERLPPDREEVLITDGGYREVGYFELKGRDRECFRTGSAVNEPTHWMPLPPPPDAANDRPAPTPEQERP